MSKADAVEEPGAYSWQHIHYSDRERAESLINAAIEQSTRESVVPAAVDAALEFAAQQWDRLGRFMRMNAARQADVPQLAVMLQQIAIAAVERAEHLRSLVAEQHGAESIATALATSQSSADEHEQIQGDDELLGRTEVHSSEVGSAR